MNVQNSEVVVSGDPVLLILSYCTMVSS